MHVPTDGTPLKGYELARADIEKRDGDDKAMTKSSPSLWTSLFKGKSNDEEDEGSSAPAVNEKTAPVGVMAAAAPAKSGEPVPMPRAKPSVASTFQLASADVQIVQPGKSKQAAATSVEKTEPNPQTPADIISARGFWGTPRQRRTRRRRRRLPPLTPAGRSAPAIRNRPQAFPPHPGTGLRAGGQFTG